MQATAIAPLIINDFHPIPIRSLHDFSDAFLQVIFDDTIIGEQFIRSVVQNISPVLTLHFLHPQTSIGTCKNENVTSSLFSSSLDNAYSSESTIDLLRKSSHESSHVTDETNLLHSVENTIVMILVRLRERMHIRQTEVHYAITLFDRVVSQPQAPFEFTVREFSMTFLICLMLAHKMSADIAYRNSAWCSVFGIPLRTLNESESVIFAALGFNLSVSASELERIRYFLLTSSRNSQQ